MQLFNFGVLDLHLSCGRLSRSYSVFGRFTRIVEKTMSVTQSHRILTALVLVGAFVAAGCGSSSPSPTSPSGLVSSEGLNGSAPPPGWVDAFPRQANTEAIEVCKVYVGTVGPDVRITVAADIGSDGSVDTTYDVFLGHNDCQDVWISESPGDTVTLTEQVPAGYTASYVKQTMANGQLTTFPSVQGNSASGLLANGLNGALVTFTNTEVPNEDPDPGLGRFTGGGNQVIVGGARISRGLTLHCDLLLSNNLEVNWQGNQFHMLDHLTTLECSDDPAIIQAPPPAPLDTFRGVGQGRYNGQEGYTIEFTLQDYGEPGRNDRAALKIYPTGSPNSPVLNVPLQLLTSGNLQAHYDQPHK